MKFDVPADRERHLLALRSAAPVLLFGGAFGGFFSPLTIDETTPAAMFDLVVAMLSLTCFGLIYVYRKGRPNHRIQLAANQPTVGRWFAVRTAVGAMLGMWGFGAMLTASVWLGPGSRRDPADIMELFIVGSICSGTVLACLVYAFAPVLYLKVNRFDQPMSKANYGASIGFVMAIGWINDIYQQSKTHPFWQSVGTETWYRIATVLAFGTAWVVYSRTRPNSPQSSQAGLNRSDRQA